MHWDCLGTYVLLFSASLRPCASQSVISVFRRLVRPSCRAIALATAEALAKAEAVAKADRVKEFSIEEWPLRNAP